MTDKPKHTLVVIGWLGMKKAYIDVPRDEAIKRYCAEWGQDALDSEHVDEYTFTDELWAYDVSGDPVE